MLLKSHSLQCRRVLGGRKLIVYVRVVVTAIVDFMTDGGRLGRVNIVTFTVGAKAFPPLFGSFNKAFSRAKTLHGAPEGNACTAG